MTASARASSVSASEVVERLDQFAYWTDECITIPGLNVRVGLDPIIGLMPVWGDVAGAIDSCYVPYQAYRAGAPISLIFAMLAIIVIEAVVGAIPVAGDLVDAVVKSNKINVRMLKDHLGV
jgi:predicted aconitase with swiveling domain